MSGKEEVVGKLRGKMCLRVLVDLLVPEGGSWAVLGHSKKILLQNRKVGSPGEQWPQVAIGREGCVRSAGPLLASLLLLPSRWLSGTSVDMGAGSGHGSH